MNQHVDADLMLHVLLRRCLWKAKGAHVSGVFVVCDISARREFPLWSNLLARLTSERPLMLERVDDSCGYLEPVA